MPRARFKESLFKRDKLGRFAIKAGGGTSGRRAKPGLNAQRREAGRKKLKAANVVRGHQEYREKHAERIAAGKSGLAGIGNTEKQLPKAEERLRQADVILQQFYLDADAHKIMKEEIARRTTRGKTGGAKGLTKERRDRIQLDARAKKVKREREAADKKPSAIRRRMVAVEKQLSDAFVKMDFEAFQKLTDEERQKEREKPDHPAFLGNRLTELQEQLNNAEPDRSRKLSEATTREQAVDIMIDRNPKLRLEGWDEPDGPISKAESQFSLYGARRDQNTKKVIQAFQGMERMLDKYPEVTIDQFSAADSSTFGHPNTIAHCRRGVLLMIDFNVNFLTIKSPNDSTVTGPDQIGFHPKNFNKRPWANTVIHEFGHALDWHAFGFRQQYDTSKIKDADQRERNLGVIGSARGQEMKNALASRWVDLGEPHLNDADIQALPPERRTKSAVGKWIQKNMSGYSFASKKTGAQPLGAGPRIINDDEALAEAFQDVEANGDKASDTSKALHKLMVDSLRKKK